MADQLPFSFPAPAGMSRDDLVVTPANQAAIALIDHWPSWPAPVVALVGPAGSGKSHIAAAWRDIAGAVTVDPAAAEAAVATLDRPVLIEDCDRSSLDETGLFHLVNAARSFGHAVLLTARVPPAAWTMALPDLASRLKAATLVTIAEPDDALLAAVIAKLFADRQVEVEPHVVAFLVRRIERSLATAQKVVDALDRAAIARGGRISRALAGDIVAAFDQGRLDL